MNYDALTEGVGRNPGRRLRREPRADCWVNCTPSRKGVYSIVGAGGSPLLILVVFSWTLASPFLDHGGDYKGCGDCSLTRGYTWHARSSRCNPKGFRPPGINGHGCRWSRRILRTHPERGSSMRCRRNGAHLLNLGFLSAGGVA